jgi:uncharacterized protein with HEPN domain
MTDFDHDVLLKIRANCNEIMIMVQENAFDIKQTMTSFNKVSLFSMFILQIGQLSTNLSGEFKNQYSQIPWNDLTKMSNKIFTDFFSVNTADIWNLAVVSIPKIYSLCQEVLGNEIFEIKLPN